MTREEVIELLIEYRANTSRAQYISAQIKGLERQLQIAINEQILDSQALTAQLTGMPHGTGTSDQTANIAIKLADGEQTERVKQIRRQIQRFQANLDMYRNRTMFVDAWLLCLTERQRIVIRQKTIGGAFKRDVIAKLYEVYGERYGIDGVKRIERCAINAICKIACEQECTEEDTEQQRD